jgi:putative pre-16S rRNA nuclease
MARVLAIDFGLKRIGLAVTDPQRIIATPLDFIDNKDLEKYLKDYFQKEAVDCIVIGEPLRLSGKETHITKDVHELSKRFEKIFPQKKIVLIDERFSSKIALESMIMGGTKKKYRREKGNIDKTSAVIILQSFLEQQEQ